MSKRMPRLGDRATSETVREPTADGRRRIAARPTGTGALPAIGLATVIDRLRQEGCRAGQSRQRPRFVPIPRQPRVAAHRVVFFRKSQEAQASLRPGRLRMTPSAERRTVWRQDYDAMRESMFFGDAPTFDEILSVLAEFERRFNAGNDSVP